MARYLGKVPWQGGTWQFDLAFTIDRVGAESQSYRLLATIDSDHDAPAGRPYWLALASAVTP